MFRGCNTLSTDMLGVKIQAKLVSKTPSMTGALQVNELSQEIVHHEKQFPIGLSISTCSIYPMFLYPRHESMPKKSIFSQACVFFIFFRNKSRSSEVWVCTGYPDMQRRPFHHIVILAHDFQQLIFTPSVNTVNMASCRKSIIIYDR